MLYTEGDLHVRQLYRKSRRARGAAHPVDPARYRTRRAPTNRVAQYDGAHALDAHFTGAAGRVDEFVPPIAIPTCDAPGLTVLKNTRSPGSSCGPARRGRRGIDPSTLRGTLTPFWREDVADESAAVESRGIAPPLRYGVAAQARAPFRPGRSRLRLWAQAWALGVPGVGAVVAPPEALADVGGGTGVGNGCGVAPARLAHPAGDGPATTITKMKPGERFIGVLVNYRLE